MKVDRRNFIAGSAAATAAPRGAVRAARQARRSRSARSTATTAAPPSPMPYRNGWKLALEQVNAKRRRHRPQARDHPPRRRRQAGGRGAPRGRAAERREGRPARRRRSCRTSGSRVTDFANQNKRAVRRVRAADRRARVGAGQPLHFRLRPSTYMQAAMLVEEAAKLPAKKWATAWRRTTSTASRRCSWFKELLKARKPGRRVRRRAMAGARQASSRRHRPGARRRQARGDLQRDVRRRPDQVRAPGQHARPVRGPLGREHADRRARISRSAGRETPKGWIVTGYPWDQINTPDAHARSARPIARNTTTTRGSARWSASTRSTRSPRRSPRPARPTPRSWSRRFAGSASPAAFGAGRVPRDRPSVDARRLRRQARRSRTASGVMVDWRYADGKSYLPSDAVVKTLAAAG